MKASLPKTCRRMLRGLGYHVPVTVGTGEPAIQTALQNQPDLILMDIQLRGQYGWCASGRSDQFAARCSRSSTSRRTLTKPRCSGRKAPSPFGFLVKPFEERAIQAGIEMALYKHQTDKQHPRARAMALHHPDQHRGCGDHDRSRRERSLSSTPRQKSSLAGRMPKHWAVPMPMSFRFLTRPRATAPADRVAKALDEGASGSFSNHTLLVRRDASEVHIEHSVAPIRQGLQEQIDGCVIVFNDVSERKAVGRAAPASPKDGRHRQTRGRHRA